MNTQSTLGRWALAFIFLVIHTVAQAAVPEGINYQAYLTDSDGSPIDSSVSITFAAYTVDVGGVPLWSSTETVAPENGLFSVTLGNPANPFPADLFDTPVFIGLFVAGEEMLPRRALKTAAYSFKAADADRLTGMTAGELDQSAEVADLESDVNTLISNVSSNTSAIGAATSDIAANSAAASNNAGDITVNSGRITTLEANPGDITGVIAGPGLTGGSASGNATLGIASGGITAGFMATNSVTTSSIANGTIRGEDIDSNTDVEVRQLTTDGETVIGGELIIDSVFDTTINDDFHGLRWRNTAGDVLHGSIEVRAADMKMRDNVRNRIMIASNVNGVGIGTDNPLNTHDVTIPSLVVTGNIDIGRERVNTSYDLSSTTPQCHSAGNLPCFYGTGTAVCPVGKKLLGGGSSGSSGRFGSLAISAPTTDTTFTCAASYDLANTARTCYAICARVD